MKTWVIVLCAAAAGLAGGFAASLFEPRPRPTARSTRATAGDIAADADRDEKIAELVRRVRALESERRPAEPTAKESATPDRVGAEGAKASPGAEAEGSKPARKKATLEDVAKLVEKLRGKEMTHDASNRLFAWLTLNKEQIEATVSALEKVVKENPDDPELQVALATAYVAKLTNLTLEGPQQGLVWAKASAAYDAAIKVKPEHWQARFGKAFGISMAPEFLGMRPVAIKQFEELRAIQERGAPEPHHVQTYFRLGTLYKNMGNAEKAREIWDSGLKLFPDNQVLKDALEASTKR